VVPPTKLKKAGSFVYTSKKQKILLVQSRGQMWGPPKGSIQPNEEPLECAIREVKEETGLDIISYKEVYTRIDDIYHCTTFLCETSGEINITNEKETGIIKELTWEELFEGPFGDYNRGLYNHLYSEKN
jgi:8-oxo-dGTP pyrophosphatase MutT (NUDIX family)